MKPDDFEAIPGATLLKLADALDHGNLSHGVTQTALGKELGMGNQLAMDRLLGLSEEGWTSGQMAYLLRQIAGARNEEHRVSQLLDLVISGPDIPGVVMRATGSVFQEIVSRAEEEVLMASFAIYNGQSIFAPLVERWRERPTMAVKLFLDIPRPRNDTTIDSALVARYRKQFIEKEWPGEKLPELYHFLPALESNATKRASMHAKVVVVDRSEVFVSSANFTNAAQTKNIEVGVKISHPASAVRVWDFFNGALREGEFSPF